MPDHSDAQEDPLSGHEDALESGPARYGAMTWFRHDDPVGKALSLYGEWAQAELDLLLPLVPVDGTVVDVGAYVGTHTLGFAHRVGERGRVVAVEPSPLSAAVLRRNTAALPQVQVHQAAAGAEPGELRLRTGRVDEHGNFGGNAADREGSERVPVLTVDGLGLQELHLVKVDVEGMEADVLRGAADAVRRHRPVLYLECNDVEHGAPVLLLARELGYRAWLHRARAYDPHNLRGEPRDVFGHAHETNLLLLPDGTRSPDLPGLLPVATLDDLAAALLQTPRYGDASDHERDPEALRREREQLQQQLREQLREHAREQEAERQRSSAALAEAQAERERLQSQLQAERAAHRRAQEQLRAVQGSTSWRVTRPLRSARDAVDAAVGRSALGLVRQAAAGRLRSELAVRRDAQRLLASGLFDVEHYLEQHPDVPTGPRAAAEHYLRHGSAEGRTPNRHFDPSWYREQYPDVAASGVEPLLHYVLAGSAEGRDPSPAFRTSWYRGANADVRAADVEPLLHFLRSGEAEGRAGAPAGTAGAEDRGDPAPRPVEPSEEEWAQVAPPAGEPVVDVVVPVYRGVAETLRCLHRALSAPTRTPFELVVVDDASPQPELSAALDRLAERGLLTLLRNEENLGFVGTANRGMRLHPDRDVVLLNADTEVFGDWLDRLRAAALQGRRGTVTPLTNNGTIASYPRFVQDNDDLLELSHEELDALVASTCAGEAVEVPTCVGFCTYVRRACLDEVGLLDEAAFGRGYGEENDLSRRAEAHGWSNVLALDVFVRHLGSTSFGASATALQRQGLEVLNARYPGYDQLVAAHIARDPGAPARRALDVARLQRLRAGRPSLLLVTHALGGGTRRHVRELAADLERAGVLPLVLTPRPEPGTVQLGSPAAPVLPNLRLPLVGPELVDLLRQLEVRHVHVHHLQGLGPDAPARVRALAERLGVDLDVTLHDFLALCPRIDMVDGSRRYCGGPQAEKCRACVQRNGSPFGRVDAAAWQEEHAALLRSARRLYAPSADTARRYAAALPGLDVSVRPHAEVPLRPEPAVAQADPSVLRVAVLGAVGVSKGSRVLLALARDAHARALPLSFHVLGHTDDDRAFRDLPTVSISGGYAEDELPGLVAASGCTVALFPGVWPETFSYTLSAALDLGLQPVAFDLGAVPERMRAAGHGGTVLPWELLDRPGEVNDRLLALPARPRSSRPLAQYDDLLGEYYGLELT